MFVCSEAQDRKGTTGKPATATDEEQERPWWPSRAAAAARVSAAARAAAAVTSFATLTAAAPASATVVQ